MPFLEAGDSENPLKIAYDSWGDKGPWVTLVSGYTRPRTDLKAMGRYLSERGLRPIALDNRGAGEAECAPVFTVEDLAEDLVRLWDHLGCDRSHLFGIGYGAAVVLTVAALHPTRVGRLVLAGPPRHAKDLAFEMKGPSRDPRRLGLELARYFSPQFVGSNRAVVQGFMRQMAKIYQEPDTALGARAQRGSMEELDLLALVDKIAAPCLVLAGENDNIIPSEAGKEIAEKVKGAEFRLIPKAGHLLYVEEPKALYETVEFFFRGE